MLAYYKAIHQLVVKKMTKLAMKITKQVKTISTKMYALDLIRVMNRKHAVLNRNLSYRICKYTRNKLVGSRN